MVIFILISAIVIFLIILNFYLPQPQANVAVSPSNKIVNQGQSFILNVSIDPLGAAISGAQLDITYNQSFLNLNSVIEGNVFTQDGASTYFNNGTINYTAGTVKNIIGVIVGPGNISTSGTFVRLNFTVIGQSGISEIQLSNVRISDPDALAVPLITTNGTININSENNSEPLAENNTPKLTVIPSVKTIAFNQDFTLNVSIDPKGTGIAGAQLNIEFNKSILKINDIIEGNLFKQDGASTLFNSGVIDNTKGTVENIYAAIIGASNVTLQGTFVTINATAIGASGISGFDLSNIMISNPQGNPIVYNLTNGMIKINDPPVLAPINYRTANEGELLSFNLAATDLNGDTLSYSASNMPSGATFDVMTKTFAWTPTFFQSGTYPDVHFEVTDGDLAVFENITITVINANRAPTFTPLPPNGSVFNETDIIYISANAIDLDNDTLSYFIKIDNTQVSTSSNYNWTTNYSDEGNHEINISVFDGTELVSKTISVYINNVYPRYDVNENGIVDIGDIAIIGQHFNEVTTPPYPRYDVNMDGIVNIEDMVIAGQYFGEAT